MKHLKTAFEKRRQKVISFYQPGYVSKNRLALCIDTRLSDDVTLYALQEKNKK